MDSEVTAAVSGKNDSVEWNYSDYGWLPKLVGICILGFGIFMYWMIQHSGPNPCRVDDQRWITFLMGSFFSFFGFVIIYETFINPYKWNENSVELRDWKLKKTIVKYDQLIDIKEVWWSHEPIVVDNMNREFLFPENLKNAEKLYKKVREAVLKNNPEKYILIGFREDVQDSQKCGCLSCLSIYKPADIQRWQYVFNGEQTDEDLAVCPACQNKESVVCDRGIIDLDEQLLLKINTTIEAELLEDEIAERHAIRDKAQQFRMSSLTD